jgi:glyoxylase-like metal-dependent hydrolase (beta-lactamase superfamily II)
MLEIKSFIFGPFQTNTYVVSGLTSHSENGLTSHILLVDPACYTPYEQQQLFRYIESVRRSRSVSEAVCQCNGLSGEAGLSIVATHGHLDHLWGAKWATDTWHTPVLIHEADIPMARAMQQQYDMFGVRATAEPFPMEPLNQQLSIINFQFSIIPTPGHTPGSVCLYFPNEKTLLSGDTLFQMGYGRTDLPGGNMGQLIESLEHLFTLPSDVIVYPGHGDFTTIGAEKR